MLASARSIAAGGDLHDILEFYKSLEILTPHWLQRLNAATVSSLRESLRPLINYFINRYWLQAVSDYDLICRVKFMISACLLLSYIPGNTAQNAQLFSKEIENDPDNVEALLDAAYTSPAFTDALLLGLLLA